MQPRSVLVLAAALFAVTSVAACGSGSSSTAVPSPSRPTDTSSPTGTASESGYPVAGTATAPTVTSGLQLPGCMVGSWTAPVTREFDHLGVKKQSDGDITGGSGSIVLALTADHHFTYTYKQVRLQMSAGTAMVNGPVSGIWTLTGNTMKTNVTGSTVSTKMNLAGFDLPSGVDDATVRSFTPNNVMVACTGSGLNLVLPSAQGGGTVVMDKA